MHNLLYNISQVLGITILHSLWQGLLIYLVLRLLLLAKPSLSAAKKYYLLLAALFCISLWFAYTFFGETKNMDRGSMITVAAQYPLHGIEGIRLPHAPIAYPNLLDSYKYFFYNAIKSYLPYLSVLYAIGLIINLSNLGIAWNKIRMIKRDLIPAIILQEAVNQLSGRLNIFKYTQVNFSKLVNVPCVIGYFKPILLLPIAISTQLSDAEIEAILLHELTHIRNNDYLINLIQQALSVLLFFNPFAHHISRMASLERESRCDDNVVQVTRNPLTYAQALLKLEESRQSHLALAMAATSRKYYLLTRIDRIMKTKKPIVNTKHLVLAVLMFIGSISSIAWLNPEIKNGRIVSKHAEQAIHKLTTIVQKAITVEKNDPSQTSKANQPASASAILKTKLLTDTLSNTHIHTAKDTFNYTAMKKLYSSPEWLQLNIAITLYRDSLHTATQNMPELAQLEQAQKALDSAIQSKSGTYYYQKLGVQIAKDATAKYKKSPEIKKKQAEVNRLSTKIFNILINDPDEKKYQEDMERRRDSLTNAVGPYQKSSSNRLKWVLWGEAEDVKSELARQKLLNRPDVKPINDSLIVARKSLMEGPAWEEYDKMMSDPDRRKKVLAESNDPDLAKYKAAVSVLNKKIHDNTEYKKYLDKMNTAIKKHDELVHQLHWQ